MSDRDVPATSWAVWAWQAYRDGRLVEADRIEELEAKLAQQDDLVQAAVAAALREAAALMFDDLWITADNDREEGYDEGLSAAANAILALITPDAQAALDRVVAAERERCAKVAESVALPMGGKIAKAQAGYMRDTIAHHIRKGGEGP
jgi:hypothetical protein